MCVFSTLSALVLPQLLASAVTLLNEAAPEVGGDEALTQLYWGIWSEGTERSTLELTKTQWMVLTVYCNVFSPFLVDVSFIFF